MSKPPDRDAISRRLAALAGARARDAPPPPPPGAAKGPKRGDARQQTFKFAKVCITGRSEIKAVIKDMSATGARIQLEGAHPLPPEMTLKIGPTGERKRASLVWQRDCEAGLHFEPD
jgi:hypothetical protein